MSNYPRWTSLFPYPICCLCYEELHDGHKGWDVCARCHQRELAECARLSISVNDEFNKPEDFTCPCYKENASSAAALGTL